MRKRRIYLTLLLLAGAGLVGLIVVWVFRSGDGAEPVYKGKKLSQWVLELPPEPITYGRSDAEVALREIGTNALPYLLKWIGYEPAPWRLKIYEIAGKVLSRGSSILFQDRKMLRASCVVRAFGTPGLQGEGVRTELTRMLREPSRRVSRVYVGFALMYCRSEKGFPKYLPGTTGSTSYFGSDAFSLTYQTNGIPVLTVSHTNIPPVLPAGLSSGGTASVREKTMMK